MRPCVGISPQDRGSLRLDVEIDHPAYVRHMPRGGRALRDALARVTTRVVLPETARSPEPVGLVTVTASPSHFEPPDRRKHGTFSVVSHEGRLYVPLTYDDAYAGPSELGRGDFLRYLAADLPLGSKENGCDDAFNGTPLRDLTGLRRLHGNHEDGRGMPYDPERQREVLHDGRAEAAERLRAFLAEEVLLAGEAVYRRFRPLAKRVDHARIWAVPQLARLSPLWHAPSVALDRLDDAARIDRIIDAGAIPAEARAEAARLLALGPGLADRDDDVRIGLAQVAGEAAWWLHGSIRDGHGDPSEARALADGFAPYHMRLRLGALPEADLAEAQRWTRRTVAFVAGNANPRGAFRDRVVLAGTYLDAVVAPRLQARIPLVEADLDAIGGLAP